MGRIWKIHLVTGTKDPACLAGIAGTPHGNLLVVTNGSSIRMIHFIASKARAQREILARMPDAQINWDDAHAKKIAGRIFSTHAKPQECFEIALHGTPFQLDVWRALIQIPFGETTSYRQLAESSGHPSAVRAVGTAVGRNPVAVLVPCHRVIRSDGTTGQYRWGAAIKRKLLAWEAGRS